MKLKKFVIIISTLIATICCNRPKPVQQHPPEAERAVEDSFWVWMQKPTTDKEKWGSTNLVPLENSKQFAEATSVARYGSYDPDGYVAPNREHQKRNSVKFVTPEELRSIAQKSLTEYTPVFISLYRIHYIKLRDINNDGNLDIECQDILYKEPEYIKDFIGYGFENGLPKVYYKFSLSGSNHMP